ncbi:glycosyltransferase family 2 protein [Patescibacteria group bacterium]|nr:glycosyltransferase family 2 protein [Patescibacteria group bacterium]
MTPSISIIIPTLNSATTLSKCLSSITSQNYPKNKLEILVIDGGSTDTTLKIAKKHHAKILKNPLKTGEAGKAVGLKKARHQLIAFIDSDNILPTKNWLKTMTVPFKDTQIIATEPNSFTYRPQDPALTRYFAMLGANDPLCIFLGNYDRQSQLTNRWTNLKFPQQNFPTYLKIKFNHLPLPTIGANGTIIRHNTLKTLNIKNYYFDNDIFSKLLNKQKHFYFAKVKTGIIHLYAGNFKSFLNKQLRRINDYSFHLSQNQRSTNLKEQYLPKILLFQLQCLLVFPILYQTIEGFIKKPDPAWLIHPLAVYSTWFIYLYGWLYAKIKPHQTSRNKWQK